MYFGYAQERFSAHSSKSFLLRSLRSVQTKELLGGVQGTGFFIPKFIEITSSQGKRVKSDGTVIEIMLIFCMSYILTE